MEQQLEELRLLADELNIRDPRKLVAAAKRREFRDVNEQLAREALRKDVARQVLAPPPRSTGKSAAEAPNPNQHLFGSLDLAGPQGHQFRTGGLRAQRLRPARWRSPAAHGMPVSG